MGFLQVIAYFLSGAFIANSIPHIVNGTSGKKFPEKSPFKNPSQNESPFEVFFFSPVVNVIWGVSNLAAGFVIGNSIGTFRIGLTSDVFIFMLGFTSTAIFLAWNIGRVHYKNNVAGETLISLGLIPRNLARDLSLRGSVSDRGNLKRKA